MRHGKTIGSPIAMLLANNDWKNWTESLPVEEGDPAKHKRVASPRPGHADLAGAVKYNFSEARYVLESGLGPRIGGTRRCWSVREVACCASSASKFSAT